MVAAGVGGWTVEEAKLRLTYYEVQRFWVPYMHKRGTLHLGMRLERGFALLAMVINRALGGKAEIEDYMPHADMREATIEDVMNILSGRAN